MEEKKQEAAVKRTAASMKEKLAAQKQVTIVVPIDSMNPNDENVTVQINGYTILIKRGEEVTVAEEVKNILSNAGYFGKKKDKNQVG
jgi:hypothetical protein